MFFYERTNALLFPRGYLDLTWNLPSSYISFNNGWNFRHKKLDFSNFILGLTINEDIAFKIELRHRSKYYWRKADYGSYIVDVTRHESELKQSPLSDARYTILTHMFFRLSPFWSCDIESHHGWGKHEHPYNEFKIDLYTMLSSSWKVRVSYMHTQTDNRFTGAITLLRK